MPRNVPSCACTFSSAINHWRYIKTQRQENTGVAPLKKNGTLVNGRKELAEILNHQFESVFTRDDGSPIPLVEGLEYPNIHECAVSNGRCTEIVKGS